jgi:ribosomal 30S subunit maturation factor RimM
VTGTPPARLAVGLVRGFRGLRGHVRVELLTDRPEDRFVVGESL